MFQTAISPSYPPDARKFGSWWFRQRISSWCTPAPQYFGMILPDSYVSLQEGFREQLGLGEREGRGVEGRGWKVIHYNMQK